MAQWHRPSAVMQLASYLRGELAQARWTGRMPGVMRLANELGVARNTVEGALKSLEKDGLLLPQGHGQGRLICQDSVLDGQKMRVALLRNERMIHVDHHLAEIQHHLHQQGFHAIMAEKSLEQVRQDPQRLEKLVAKVNAGAWVVMGGPRIMLEWFVERGIPLFSVFGRRHDLPVAGAGPDKSEAYRQVVRELAARGHRRIVLITLKSGRSPEPGPAEQAFLDELQAHDIATGPYNLPDWRDTPDDLERLLNAIFEVTPPTALLVGEPYLFHAVKHHLGTRGIRSPQEVSLICTDPDRGFAWCRPSIAHIRWNHQPLLRHLERWAVQVRLGKAHHKQLQIPAQFVPGGTLGEPRKN